MSELDESGIFDASLSMWKGLTQNKDGTFSYESEEFDPIPLDIFTAASLGETEIVQDLLASKTARPSVVNSMGWSPLMYASYMGHESTVQCLLDATADPNQRTPQGYSSIILASMCGNDHCIHVLIQQGGDINAVDKRGWSALFHSASAGHQQTTEFLIKCGANCEVMEPSQGLTPLMEAAASGHEIIVQQLLQKGVDVARVNHQGENAWTLALAFDHRKIASMIEQHKKYRRPKTNLPGYSNHKNGKTPKDDKCGQSGPSIHAGPKAFAQMTGLGSDGKPHPHATVPHFLQDHPPSHANNEVRPPSWEGPKDLETLLSEIDCSKHLPIFNKQDIDLRVFLTLTEDDLKEIGITLFGPRRRMVSCIARLSSGAPIHLDRIESAYADSLNAKLLQLQNKLKECQEEKEELKSQGAQERELRKVTEGVLMEHKEMWAALLRITEKSSNSYLRIAQALDHARMHVHQSEKTHPGVRKMNNQRQENKGEVGKALTEVETSVRLTRDYMMKIQNILQRSSNRPQNLQSDRKDRG